MINNDTLHDNGMYIHWFIGDIISDGEKLRFRGVKDISDNLYIYITNFEHVVMMKLYDFKHIK